jgi:hypothetical protein
MSDDFYHYPANQRVVDDLYVDAEDVENEERGDIASALRDLGYNMTADEVGGMTIEDARVAYRMMVGVEWNWEGQRDKWQAQALHEAEALDPEFDPDHTYDPYGNTKHRYYEDN